MSDSRARITRMHVDFGFNAALDLVQGYINTLSDECGCEDVSDSQYTCPMHKIELHLRRLKYRNERATHE